MQKSILKIRFIFRFFLTLVISLIFSVNLFAFQNHLCFLSNSDKLAEFEKLITENKGRISHLFNNRTLICFADEAVIETALLKKIINEARKSTISIDDSLYKQEDTKKTIEIWNQFLEEQLKFKNLKPHPNPNLNLLEEKVLVQNFFEPESDSYKPYNAYDNQTSSYASGKVSVTLLFPESNGTIDAISETWTEEEITLIKARIILGLDNFASFNPDSGLTFVYDYVSSPPINGVPGTISCDYEAITRNNFDSAYLDNILNRLGFSGDTGFSFFRNFTHSRRDFNETDWGFFIVVKNNLNSGGGRPSAYIGGPGMCIFSDTDATVITHETAHIFWAQDEYHPDAGISPLAMSGYLHFPNANSQFNDGKGYNDGAGEGVPALMVNNSNYMSPYTRGAIGWIDRNSNGIIDILDTFPLCTLNYPTGSNPYSFTASANVVPYLAYQENPNSTNIITDAEYRINKGIWIKATPVDGQFSQALEQFTFSTPSLPNGEYIIEVRAKNDKNNWSGKFSSRKLVVSGSTVNSLPPDCRIKTNPEYGSTSTKFNLKALCSDHKDNTVNLEVRWDLNNDNLWDTNFVKNKSIDHIFAVSGNHTVRCEVKNSAGLSSYANITLTVTNTNHKPVAAFEVQDQADSFGNLSPSFSFNAEDSYDSEDAKNLQYRWDWESDGIWDTEYSYNHTATKTYKLNDYRFSLKSMPDQFAGLYGKKSLIFNDFLFVASSYSGINIYDISSPESPGTSKTIANSNAVDIKIYNGYLYCASENLGFKVYDIDPLESSYETADFSTDFVSALDIYSNFLFTACGFSGVKIYDISNPATPAEVSNIAISGSTTKIKISEHLLFTLSDSGFLNIYDITNSTSPIHRSSLNLGISGAPADITIKGTTAAVAYIDKSLMLIDFTNPLSPIVKSNFQKISPISLEAGTDVIFAQCKDSELLYALNIDNPQNAYIRGFIKIAYITSMNLKDNYLFFTSSSHNIGVIKTYPDSPAHSKNWNVRLEVMDSTGLTSICTRNIWANPYNHRPVSSFTINPVSGSTSTNFLFNAGDSVDQDLSNNWDNIKYFRWDFNGDGNYDTPFSESNSNIYQQFSTPGVYKIICEVRDRYRAISKSEKILVVSNDGTGNAPVAQISMISPSALLNNITNFTGAASNDPDSGTETLSFIWDFDNDGIWDTIQSLNPEADWIYEKAGNYTVKLRVYDSTGLFNDAFFEATVLPVTSGPYSTITFPVNGSVITTASNISGTAADSSDTITKIEIRILRQGPFYLRPDGVWTSTETWFEPSGGNVYNWSHDISGVTFESGISYLIKSRAYNSSGSIEIPGPGSTFTIGTNNGPDSICSGLKITDSNIINISVTSSNPNAIVSLWYKKEGSPDYIDSGQKVTGSGEIQLNLSQEGLYHFYTVASYNSTIEPIPSLPDFSCTFRTDLPCAKKLKLVYTNTSYWFQLNELEVYASTSYDAPAKFNINSIEISSPAHPGFEKEKLIDGLVNFNNDFAVSNPTLPFIITLTLDEPAFISAVHHYNDGQYGASEVKIEADGLTNGAQWILFGNFSGLNLTENTTNIDYLSLESKIIINEVYPGNPGYIELFNAGTSSVNIQNWKIFIDSIEFICPSFSLGGGKYAAVTSGSGVNSSTKIYTNFNFPWYFNSPGSASLINSDGTAADFVRWGSNTNPVPAGTAFAGVNPSNPPTGKSLGRNFNSKDTDNGFDWTVQNPSLLDKNTDSDKYMISGYIKDENGQPVQSATLTLNGGFQAVSDMNGFYLITDLDPGSYSITPSALNYSFQPSSLSTVIGPDKMNADFIASPPSGLYSISGWIRDNAQGISDVTLTINNGNTVKTKSSGYYYFPGLAPSSYSIVPSKSGYSFSPNSMNITLTSNSEKEKNFTAIPGSSLFSISGIITTSSGSPLPGVSISAEGQTVITDNSGYYIIPTLTSGTFNIEPSKEGFNFSPAQKEITLGPDAESVNFTGIENTFSSKRVSCRYLKFKYTLFNDSTWLQINEIGIYGSENDFEISQKLRVSQIIASKEPFSGYGVSKLIDEKIIPNGDFAVNIKGIPIFELVFDMGKELSVDKIIHTNDMNYGGLNLEILASSASSGGPYESVEIYNNLTIKNQEPGQDVLSFSKGKININEINLDTDGYIEFYNSGTTDINLAGWTFSGGNKNYTFPIVFLKKGEFFLLKNGSGVDLNNEKYLFDSFQWGPGTQGSAALKDEKGKGIDFVRWGTSTILPPSGTFWTGINPAPPASGQSLSRNFTSTDTDSSIDFILLNPSPLIANSQLFTLSGYIKNSSMQPVSGVSLEIEGVNNILTDSQGKFTISLPNGAYHVVPLKEGYNFSPQYKIIQIENSHIIDCNFSAAGGATLFTASGYIKDENNQPIGNAIISTQGFTSSKSSTETGFWIIPELPAGQYELIPDKSGVSFSPPKYQITLGPSRSSINFTSTASEVPQFKYVDAESTADIEDGTLSYPFKTITNAVNTSPEGANIYIRAGNYNESFTLKTNQSLIGEGAFNTFINGQGFDRTITLSPGCSLEKIAVYDGNWAIYSNGSDGILKNIAVSNSENGIYIKGASLSLKNCTVVNINSVCISIEPGALFSCSSSILDSITQNGGNVSGINYTNIINGGYGLALGTGNISANPSFLSLEGRDFRLNDSSPCINSGSPDINDNDEDQSRNDMGVFGGKNPGELISKILPLGVYTDYEGYPGYRKDKLTDNKKQYNNDYAIEIKSQEFKIIYDFGKDIEFKKVIFFNDGLFGAGSVKIDYAKESSSNIFENISVWDNLVLINNNPGKNVFTFNAVTGRYIKFSINDFRDNKWFQLNEIEVYTNPVNTSSNDDYFIPYSAVSIPEAYPGYDTDKLFNSTITFNNQFAVKNNNKELTIVVDMGLNVTLSQIHHYNDGQFGANSVALSYASEEESSLFIDIDTFSNLSVISDRPNEDLLTFPEITGRYFKLKYHDFNNISWMQISEIKFSGTPVSNDLIKPVAAVSAPSSFPLFGTENLYDGSKNYNSDYACKNLNQPVIITIDLGTEKTFNLIRSFNDGFYGAEKCKLEVAPAGSPENFTVISIDNPLLSLPEEPKASEIRFSPYTGQFIKITYSSFKDPVWFQLNEIEIYNQDSSSINDYSETRFYSSNSIAPVQTNPISHNCDNVPDNCSITLDNCCNQAENFYSSENHLKVCPHYKFRPEQYKIYPKNKSEIYSHKINRPGKKICVNKIEGKLNSLEYNHSDYNNKPFLIIGYLNLQKNIDQYKKIKNLLNQKFLYHEYNIVLLNIGAIEEAKKIFNENSLFHLITDSFIFDNDNNYFINNSEPLSNSNSGTSFAKKSVFFNANSQFNAGPQKMRIMELVSLKNIILRSLDGIDKNCQIKFKKFDHIAESADFIIEKAAIIKPALLPVNLLSSEMPEFYKNKIDIQRKIVIHDIYFENLLYQKLNEYLDRENPPENYKNTYNEDFFKPQFIQSNSVITAEYILSCFDNISALYLNNSNLNILNSAHECISLIYTISKKKNSFITSIILFEHSLKNKNMR